MEPDGALVLGMHRSGTSAVTRVLSFLGLSTCRPLDLIRAVGGNERGHWESRSLTVLNDELLHEMNGAWWCPPRPDEVRGWAAGAAPATIDRLRGSHRSAHPARPWVWKDPRLCITLPIWAEALDGRFANVLVIRHPLEIADSLAARNGTRRAAALELWELHLASALEHLDGSPVWVTRYRDLLSDPLGWCDTAIDALASAGLELGLRTDGAELVRNFLSDDLRHHSHDADRAPTELSEGQLALWRWLDSSVGHHPRLSTSSLGRPPLRADLPGLARSRQAFIESRRSADQ